MKDNVLKKEFKEKDVERVRNLVKGKAGDKTIVGIGYEKPEEEHSEGDVWLDNNKKWTIKNGIKVNITTNDEAVKSVSLPLFCPSCKTPLKPSIDRLIFLQHSMCLNCLTKKESELKITGKWEEYQKKIINNDIDNYIQQVNEYYDDLINKNDIFITEDGVEENWTGLNKDFLDNLRKEAIEHLEKLKK